MPKKRLHLHVRAEMTENGGGEKKNEKIVLVIDFLTSERVLVVNSIKDENIKCLTMPGNFSINQAQTTYRNKISLVIYSEDLSGNGFENTKKLFATYFPGVPFIILSPRCTQEHLTNARLLGASDFFAPPIDYQLLRERVFEILYMSFDPYNISMRSSIRGEMGA